MLRDGVVLHAQTLYSGRGEGLNNPEMEAVRGTGPIPRGRWRITHWGDDGKLGKIVAFLVPVGHNAHGRTLFRMHGDNSAANHTASDGCIIADRNLRVVLEATGDMDLEVV